MFRNDREVIIWIEKIGGDTDNFCQWSKVWAK
jgi:hypothetical protein